jgi:hypothetical protein
LYQDTPGPPDLAAYRTPDGIVRFVREVIGGQPTPYQEDILRHFAAQRRVAVRAPHGAGKTSLSAWIVLWAVAVFDPDVKVITTAGVRRQLERFTWPEIKKWAGRAAWDKIGLTLRGGKELLDTRIKLPEKEAFAATTHNPALIEGAHAAVVVYIFDEAKAIPAAIFDAAEGAFSSGVAFALAISTPGEAAGRFYEIHARRPGYEDWWVRHITLEEAIAAGRILPEWAEARKRQWGESSAVYQNRVLGEFAIGGEDNVIPLAWIASAVARWHAANGHGEGRIGYGVDVARYGEDQTAIVRLAGRVIERVDRYAKQDTMQTTGRVIVAVGGEKSIPIAVDVIGIGAGVYDRLHEQGFTAIPVNVAIPTDRIDHTGQMQFLNLRAALWWALREALDPEGGILLALPPDDALIGDLTAPIWHLTSTGRIQIEPKVAIKRRLGRSPDAGDAAALALWAAQGSIPTIAFVALDDDLPASEESA